MSSKQLNRTLLVFLVGVAVGALATNLFSGSGSGHDGEKSSSRASSSSSKSQSEQTSTAIFPDVTLSAQPSDWGVLVDNMCRPDSELNVLATKLDFPFQTCQSSQGEIDASCVAQDAKRFQLNLPEPYQKDLGELNTHLNVENGWHEMHYLLPLKDASYHGMPLKGLAIHVNTGDNNSTEMQGWQTPYVVVQEDFSKIKSALAENQPKPQEVFYANVPENSQIPVEAFSTLEQAQRVSQEAGGNPNEVSKQIMTLEANFNERLQAVTLGCVSVQ